MRVCACVCVHVSMGVCVVTNTVLPQTIPATWRPTLGANTLMYTEVQKTSQSQDSPSMLKCQSKTGV